MPSRQPIPRTDAEHAFSMKHLLGILGVILFISTLAILIAGPKASKSKLAPICASNLKKIGQAYNLYQEDNDGHFPRWGLVTEPMSFSLNLYCPMYKLKYSDTYMKGVLKRRVAARFEDGTLIPKFDPRLDVLARCMSHGYDGYDNKGSRVTVISPEIRGRVLGVRLDGSVSKVFYLSCFEYTDLPAGTMESYKNAPKYCDRLND